MSISFTQQTISKDSLMYLASPYTSKSKLRVQTRQMLVEMATAELLREGHLVYSPIAHCHNLAERYGLPGHSEFWHRLNETMLSRCDALGILVLSGWNESSGIADEVEIAQRLEKPVYLVDFASDTSLNVEGPYEAARVIQEGVTLPLAASALTRQKGS